jgi:hypothetical protein
LIEDRGSHYMATSPQGLWRERHKFLVVSYRVALPLSYPVVT